MELRGVRVALVNWRDPGHSLAGGSERYAWELASGLAEAGADVEFLTAQDPGQARHELLDGVRVYRRGGQFTFYAWSLLRLAVQRIRRRPPAVVVDAENGIPSFTPLVLGRGTRVVLVVHHVHQEQFRTYFPRPVSDLGRFLEGPAMRFVYRGRTTLVVSPSTDVEMRRQLGWQGPTRLLPNGNVLPALDDDELGAAKQGQARRVLVLGRLAVHKRVDLVLQAFDRVRADRPDLRLDVVGGGPIEDELRRTVADLGLEGAVTVHGFLPEDAKNDLLRRAHLNLCGSDAEGWGQVVVEASAYGVPTVARDVPGLRDSVVDGDTGWLVPDDGTDPGVVVDRLEEGLRSALVALDDPARAQRMRAACLAWAARFTWARTRAYAVAVVAAEVGRPTRHDLPEQLPAAQPSSSTR
jgi:glycosyltransferase involved in cell wall biosynthesis